MKTTIKILCLLFWINSHSQNPLLFENTWYLQSLTIDGFQYTPPINDEIPFVPATFYQDESQYFSTGMCETPCMGLIIYNGMTNFQLHDLACLGGSCYSYPGVNEVFNQRYLSFYRLFNNESPNYNYNIVVDGSVSTLTIVNAFGDIAVFGSQILSTEQYKLDAFTVFPNPTSGVININSGRSQNIRQINLYDSNGRMLKSYITGDTTLDLNELQQGIYFVSIKPESEVAVVKKIIKI